VTKLPSISGRECVTALQRGGFVIRRQKGSHIIMRRNDITTVVPDHRELDRGTLRAIIRQAGLTVEEFMTLMSGESLPDSDTESNDPSPDIDQ
jgi:predicted RNA binding protein YcfA (HicA-like mRNA interferase family)